MDHCSSPVRPDPSSAGHISVHLIRQTHSPITRQSEIVTANPRAARGWLLRPSDPYRFWTLINVPVPSPIEPLRLSNVLIPGLVLGSRHKYPESRQCPSIMKGQTQIHMAASRCIDVVENEMACLALSSKGSKSSIAPQPGSLR